MQKITWRNIAGSGGALAVSVFGGIWNTQLDDGSFGLECPVCHAAAPLSSSAVLDRRCSLVQNITWRNIAWNLLLPSLGPFSPFNCKLNERRRRLHYCGDVTWKRENTKRLNLHSVRLSYQFVALVPARKLRARVPKSLDIILVGRIIAK